MKAGRALGTPTFDSLAMAVACVNIIFLYLGTLNAFILNFLFKNWQ